MMGKQADEVELVRRLFGALDMTGVTLESVDRPDVIAHIEGRRIGIEVTTLHNDETQETKGSKLRALQERAAAVSGGKPHGAWVNVDPVPALAARIDRKIHAALTYDRSVYDELWLLVTAGLPTLSAVVATNVFAPLISIENLNTYTNANLCMSSFSKVYFHIIVGQALFSWSPTTHWRRLTIT